MYRKLATISLIALIIVTGFFISQQPAVQRLFFKPCAQPIEYSLGDFDPNFGITQEQFLADIDQAAQVWDQSIDKKLFQYSANGKMKINLVYDTRQQATEQLKSIGVKIENTESSYNSLKSRYESLAADYQSQKIVLDASVVQYNSQKQAYEAQVAYWNKQGGAPASEYQKLNKQHDSLNTQASQIAQRQKELNLLVDEVNALGNALNNLARQLNLNVSTYNTVGSSRGPEFEEGAYVSDSKSQYIDIYEFNDEPQLVRLLAHELGHALGLEHVDDSEAIMYRLNQATNIVPTTADLDELKRICGDEI